jgi:putative FmdB family regulatory protein
MPLYEYTCDQCEHAFEELVFDGDTVECPACSSKKVSRQFSVPAAGQSSGGLPMSSCGEGPPCGAPWCGRQKKA